MNALKNVLQNLPGIFPYIYFSLIAMQIFFDHLDTTGTIWSELLLLTIASIFIVQLKYKFKHLDFALGIFTLCWSCWMVLAVYSDAIKIEQWTWTMKRYLVVIFLITNFISSISLLIKEQDAKEVSKDALANRAKDATSPPYP